MSDIETQVAQIEAVAVIKPGDQAMITFGIDAAGEHVMHLMDQLRERFPDVEFTALCAEQVAIVRDEAE
jgi:uncharacterized protein with HEPN domain